MISSSSALPMPCATPPCTWPSAIIGLMISPASSATRNFFDLDAPGLDIDLDDGDMAGVGEGARRIVAAGLGQAGLDLALEDMGLVIGGARQGRDGDGAIGADHLRRSGLQQ